MNFNKETRKLTADEGKVLQNIATEEKYGEIMYLGIIDSPDNYQDADPPPKEEL